MYKGEYAVIFRLTVDVPYRGEPPGRIGEYVCRQQDVVHGGREAPCSWQTRRIGMNGGIRQEQNKRHNRNVDNNSRPSNSRSIQGGYYRKRATIEKTDWCYYRKKGHKESECWKTHVNLNIAGSSQGDVEGSRRGRIAFVMKHKANSMVTSTSKSNEVW